MVLQLNHQHNKPAFVLGNGKSRLAVNPQSLLDLGIVYGCNAQYREFNPHYLIAVDVKMVNEIVESGYNQMHEVWTNPNKGILNKDHLNFFHPHKGWSSGPTALWLAASNGHQDIYILGFDYSGINGRVNNIYADSKNYRSSKDPATFYGNWLNQTENVIKSFRHINFYRVIEPLGFIPDRLKGLNNLQHITTEKFFKIFSSSEIK
jgi:hypothetical protein